MKKVFLISGVVIILLVVGFFALNSYIYNQKQGNGLADIKPYPGTLTGEYVCLPHTNTDGPQTEECAFGIKTESGEYYALDFNLLHQGQTDLKTGDKIKITGTITPVELLNSNQWQKYPIQGILSVSESVQKL